MRFKISKKGFTLLRDKSLAGFTLIDVLVGAALMLIVFLGIFGAYQLGLKVVGLSKTRIDATALVNQQMEIIRNLPYESVGTEGASLPYAEGVLDPATTTVRNNIEYTINSQIKYIADGADGLVAPEDDCYLDYKRAEIRVSWPGRFGGEVKLVTDVAPKNKIEETNTCLAQPGGILSVSVFDAYGQMVDFPLIEIFNLGTGGIIPPYSPSTGKYDFPLATSTYKVVVSKVGFSQDRTYGTNEVISPEKPHPIILEDQLTEISFSIDRVSTFLVDTLSPWGTDNFSDSFLNETKISEKSNVMIGPGEVNLATSTEGYLASGYLISIEISPSSLVAWDELTFSDLEPSGTDLNYQIYFASSTDWYLIPDSVLAGNSTGLELSPIDLSGLSTTTYSTLKIKGNFSSNSISSTPALYDWQMSWITSIATPIPNFTFWLQGAKIIGTDAAEQPVYKYSTSSVSNSSGHIDIPNLEWDFYTFSVTGENLDLVGTDPSPQPINLLPNTNIPVKLYLEAENSFLLTLQNIETLEPIFSGTARLYNAGLGYDKTQYTNEKGQTIFIPLSIADYNLELEAPGCLATSTIVSISGDTIKTVRLQRVE